MYFLGLQTYSRGYHDSLTTYYLELFKPNLTTTPWFPDLLRLFNVRYIIAKSITAEFIERCQLFKLMSLNDEMTVYVRTQEESYGYFEFVNVPGSINGDLKGIRDATVFLTQIFQVRVLLGINFAYKANERDIEASVDVRPVATPFSPYNPFTLLLYFFGRPELYETSWTINDVNVSEHDFLAKLMTLYLSKPLLSVVVKESTLSNKYCATVIVPNDAFSKVSICHFCPICPKEREG